VADLRALIVDWGGVLTTPLEDSMVSWCAADGIDYDGFRVVMKDWLGTADDAEAVPNPAHQLERGELAAPDFERELGRRLRTKNGGPVDATGLLTRMFAGFRPLPPMVDAVRHAKAAGLSTALLSNSWGNSYPREGWSEIFDAVVISGEVAMRKPDPEIFRLTARLLGLEPAQCVFVDDLMPNVRGAAAVGMVGVHHVLAPDTIAELEALLGVPMQG
jgi:putative hydrolase of the HAD superfamily